MAKTRPKKSKKRKTQNQEAKPPYSNEYVARLLTQASNLLAQGQPEEALELAQAASKSFQNEHGTETLEGPMAALELLGEIYVELGDIEKAREQFYAAAAQDPNAELLREEGGGASKFLWLAQLSEQGGLDSIFWYDKAIKLLQLELDDKEGKVVDSDIIPAYEYKRGQLSSALCAAAEVYMTDLSFDPDAEEKCEALVERACRVSRESPEPLQTMASVRISQERFDDARDCLERSMKLWQNVDPDSPRYPEFASRISLVRLLMEVELEETALEVLKRLMSQDDTSVETWYLSGWCMYLMGKKRDKPTDNDEDAKLTRESVEVHLRISRNWLIQSLRLYEKQEYEDEPLQVHAKELVDTLNQKLRLEGYESCDESLDDDSGWEDADEDVDENDLPKEEQEAKMIQDT